jgi:cobyrinic acid a,c-diamide synthase
MRRFMIAGTGSGCGKTTVTCAVLQALVDRGIRTAAFKCGPDYIDPMFHRTVIGADAHNLDPFFCGRDALCSLLDTYGGEVSVIEGVMGFYDGGETSAYAVSEMTETPVILVLNCRGMSDSLGAVMQGFLQYKTPNRIAGFIFDRLPEKLIPLAKRLCGELHTQYFGCLPAMQTTIESRHLGLVTADEIEDIKEKMQSLAAAAEAHLELDAMLSLRDAPLPLYCFPAVQPITEKSPVIAVAKDRAFCFTYAENLDVLQKLGCEIRYFSPLADDSLPLCDGLYLPGGYPELYAEALAENQSMRDSVRRALQAGMPCIAECGGFLYLHETLETAEGRAFPMVGYIPARAYPVRRLGRFGYVTLTAGKPDLLCQAGAQLTAHEFHYWESEDPGTAYHAVKPDGRAWDCAHTNTRLYAGFPHLYWYADTRPAENFVRACLSYQEERNGTHRSDQTAG